MLLCTISAVAIKTILRKFPCILRHAAVPGDLGNDACGGNRKRFPIALDDALVREREMFHGETIDEAMVDGDVVFRLQGPCRSCHAVMGGAEDVHVINRGGIHLHLCPNHVRVGDQMFKKLLAFFRREFFRIVQPLQRKSGREDHRCHGYRTCQRPASCFIDPAYPRMTLRNSSLLIRKIRHAPIVPMTGQMSNCANRLNWSDTRESRASLLSPHEASFKSHFRSSNNRISR